MFRKLFSEGFGTFCLVFAGTGAIISNNASNGAVTHIGIALTFGLVVMAMIYALGEVSGAHLNPAVTLAFCAARRFPARDVLPYIAAQCGGALFASLVLRMLFPLDKALGATHPSSAALQSFVFEVILTLILMFVILSVSQGAKEKGITAGLVVGAVIGLEALFAGPISGASMNPARSLGPAIVSGQLQHLWIYLLAPTLGALLGVAAFGIVRAPETQS